ncbi:UPF0046 protein C25E10.12 [Pelomyxa schiedti]|nr:UPF0046 protein C25E10.12 [Pelomyxa schiedti]
MAATTEVTEGKWRIMGWYNVGKVGTEQTISPKPANAVRVVCLADTHDRNLLERMTIPDGDILLHAGDFSMTGGRAGVERFARFMESMPHRYKVIIAGNHDLNFDLAYCKTHRGKTDKDPQSIKDIVARNPAFYYLEDSSAKIMGLNIYGSPWQPEFCDWAFNLTGDQLREKWEKIPSNVDILITHGPPYGHGDYSQFGKIHVGCEHLIQTVTTRCHPALHVFGHIHETYGVTRLPQNSSLPVETLFVNASNVDFAYAPNNLPVVVDLIRSST